MIKISPSVLAADLSELSAEVRAMEAAGADMIHLDVMDGHFVPNITFGAPVVKNLRPKTNLIFDVHLMISNPLQYIKDFAHAGADIIAVHPECGSDMEETLRAIHSHNVKSGIALKPSTLPTVVLPYLNMVDMIMVMTVEPGFSGQPFMEAQVKKLSEVRDMVARSGRAIDIQVDGGIDVVTAPIVAAHGANVLVAGSVLYSKPDYKAAVEELRRAATL